jgi:hypothetical protein
MLGSNPSQRVSLLPDPLRGLQISYTALPVAARARLEGPPRGVVHFLGSRGVCFVLVGQENVGWLWVESLLSPTRKSRLVVFTCTVQNAGTRPEHISGSVMPAGLDRLLNVSPSFFPYLAVPFCQRITLLSVIPPVWFDIQNRGSVEQV